MPYSLYPYQEKFIDEIVHSARSGHKKIACISPTGSGKTVVVAHLLERCIKKGRKCLFLVTITCLVEQTAEKLGALGLKFGIIAGGYKNPNYDDADIFIASLQTLASRTEWLDQKWDVVVFDESHTSCWFGVADQIINADPKRWILGFTATPYRLSKKQFFADIFTDVIVAPSMSELMELGSLVPLHYYDVECDTDFSQVKIIQGDFAQGEVSKIVNDDAVIKNALDGREKYAAGKRTICFAVNVVHAESIARIAQSRGINSAVVIGSTPFKQRTEIFNAMRRGEIELISSCMALSTGFDLPEVEVAMLMRPTKSTALLDQQIGRVARTAKGKTHGIVLDTAGNFSQGLHQLPCEKVHTKESVLARKEYEEGEAPTKLCVNWFRVDLEKLHGTEDLDWLIRNEKQSFLEKLRDEESDEYITARFDFIDQKYNHGCDARIAAHHKECPLCGFMFPVKEKDSSMQIGEYNRIITPSMVRREGTLEAHQDYYRSLLKKYHKTSLTKAYGEYARCAFTAFPKPPNATYKGSIFGGTPTQEQFNRYYKKVKVYESLKNKSGDWLMRQEFGNNWKAMVVEESFMLTA